MSAGGNRSSLLALTRDLAARWQQTREHWSDARSREFEERHLAGLLAAVDKAATAMEQLDEIVTKARKDCE